MEVGKIVRERRLELGMTREQLAVLSNVSVTTIYRLETGQYKLKKITMINIAKGLDISPKELIPDFSESMETLSVGERIKRQRILQGMSLKELGGKVGITEVAVYQIENGKSVGLKMLSKLAKALGAELTIILPIDNMNKMEKLGDKINRLRQERGMLKSELLNKAGITKTTLRDIQNGMTMPRLRTMERIAQALDVPVETFFQDN